MVAAMFIGMAVLFMPAELALNAIGSGWDELSDAAMFLGMATTMTLPMVAWMLYRGHGVRAGGEMAAAMFLPTFAVIGVLWADVLTDVGALMMIEHVAMLLAMLGAMLMRPAEYAHGASA
jgi:hypothetical protein